MKIGIIGAGWLGGTVGDILARAGHDVLFSSRRPEMHRARAARVGGRAGTVREAAEHGDAVLIAVPYRALENLGRDLREALSGRVVLDACNPYPPDPAPLIRAVEAEGVALASARLLPGTRMVRAFSAVDATAIEASAAGRGERLGVPVASDDPDALAVAEALVRDAGCEPVAVGGLAAARAFQNGGPGFRAHKGAAELRRRLGLE